MQYFLNGFQTGDPAMSDAARRGNVGGYSDQVDVLIVGSGPTGLTLAAQLAAFPGLNTRIVEQKSGPLQIGQADGIACRTMEMFEAFGFSERVLRESYWVNETCFWKPDEVRPENIVRSRVIQDVEDGLSEFPHVILNQARVHDFFLDLMRRSPMPIEPTYSRRLVGLDIDQESMPDPQAFPFTVHFEHTKQGSVARETIRARYLVGCDGARSVVRGLMGRTLDGASARQAWGVMDVLAVTNFPDIRRKSAIHSAQHGSILIIPREGGYLVRIYIELNRLEENQRAAALNVTTDQLIDTARKIMHPYTLEVKEIAWWSVYEIGQRICSRFDDQPENPGEEWFPRLFIAGDACHTHSPKAGQGMNVSMQDAFNLGWKLGSVIQGRAAPSLLRTYSEERQSVAQELIDFDSEFARMFGARPESSASGREDTVDPAEFQNYFVRQGRFTAGVATRYASSMITGDTSHQALAKGFSIGMRFHSAPVIRLADAKCMHLGHVLRADGRWRLIVFADNAAPNSHQSRLWQLCEFLERSPASPILQYTPPGSDIDAVIEVIAVCQQAHRELSVEGMPSLLVPRKGRYGLIDYEKIFCPDTTPQGNIFETRGINRETGAMVLVRPDQYVAQVLSLDVHQELAGYFQRFMCGN